MKTKFASTFIFVMILNAGLSNAQVSTGVNNGLATDYVGWDGFQAFPLIIKHEAQQSINFHTFAGTGIPPINLRMIISSNGNIGIGDNTTPLSLLHLHQNTANTATLFHITNAGTGTASNSGFDIRQENGGQVYFNQNELDFVRFQSLSSGAVAGGAILRKRIDIATYNLSSTSGLHDRTRVWIAGDYIFGGQALSLLQIGSTYGALTHGHRNWMDYGTLVVGGSDNAYFGVKNEDADIADFDDRSDAVISWGDNNSIVPDNLNDIRFIFTTELGSSSSLSSQQNGLEMARITSGGNFGVGNFYNHPAVGSILRPARRFEVLGDGGTTTDPQFRLTFAQRTATQTGRYTDFNSTTNGDLIISPISESTAGVITERRVGINTNTPGNTLSIQSTIVGNSGLQFNNLTSTFTPTFASTGKVLTVDPSGNVVLTSDLGGNFNSCGGTSTLNHIMKFSNTVGTLGCQATMQEDANGFVGMGMAPMANQGLSIFTNTVGQNRGISVATNSSTDNTMGISIYPSTFKNFQAGTYLHTNTSGSSTSSSQAFGHWVLLQGDNLNNFGVYANINGGANTQANYGVLARVTGAQNTSNIWVTPKNYGVNAEGSGVLATENYGVWGRGALGIKATGVYGYGLYGTEVNIGVDGIAYGSDVTENYGVRGQAITPGSSNYGVYGYAREATNNFGVWGSVEIWGARNYGVYGEARLGNCASGIGTCFDAAGYFNGDLYYSGGIYNSSDSKLKTQIQPLLDATSILSQLQVKTYEFDTATYPTLNLKSGLNYGLIAQDVELVLPSFVKSFSQPELLDSLGNIVEASVDFKAVSYESFIPLLLKGFQEQKNRIDSLLAVINTGSLPKTIPNTNNLDNGSNAIQRIELSNKKGIILNQNEPNPFSESTTIRFTIPEEVKEAKIIFTSISGSVINSATINERGDGILEVYSSELSKGLYNYTLICDGKIISTMKMVKQ